MAKVQLAPWCSPCWRLAAVYATTINVRNQCPYIVSACDQGTGVTCYALQNGGSREKDVGTSWAGRFDLGFPSGSGNATQGNNAKPQANLAEFTISANGQDYYDLSNVIVYNLPLMIKPTFTNGGQREGLHCRTIVCSIPDLNGFCKAPNVLAGGPGNGCRNTDGTGNVATDGTRAFKAACPRSYSYSQDDKNAPGAVYACNAGRNYEVVFCP